MYDVLNLPSFQFILMMGIGMIGGSFLGVVVTRGPVVWGLVDAPENLPSPYNLALPRSHCPSCQTTLRWRDLIPLVSYFSHQGKCGHCGTHISALYPFLEAAGLACGLMAAFLSDNLAFVFLLFVLFLSLVALSVIDQRTGYLPDAITLPLLVLIILTSPFELFGPWQQTILGTVIGYGAFWLITTVYKQVRDRDGLGLGDAKLLAVGGAVLGPFALPFIVLVAAGAAIIAVALQHGKDGIKADMEVRFGPYLSAGTALCLIAQMRWPGLMPWDM